METMGLGLGFYAMRFTRLTQGRGRQPEGTLKIEEEPGPHAPLPPPHTNKGLEYQISGLSLQL